MLGVQSEYTHFILQIGMFKYFNFVHTSAQKVTLLGDFSPCYSLNTLLPENFKKLCGAIKNISLIF